MANWRSWLYRVVGICRHDATYRERRDLDDVNGVYHFVCGDCGASWPCVSRTPQQHREMRSAGRSITAHVRKSS